MPILTLEQIQDQLLKLQFNWQLAKDILFIEIQTSTFEEAVWVISELSVVTKELAHHPDITIKNYNHLTIQTTTHEYGGLTDKDFQLAERLEGIITRIENKAIGEA